MARPGRKPDQNNILAYNMRLETKQKTSLAKRLGILPSDAGRGRPKASEALTAFNHLWKEGMRNESEFREKLKLDSEESLSSVVVE